MFFDKTKRDLSTAIKTVIKRKGLWADFKKSNIFDKIIKINYAFFLYYLSIESSYDLLA
ncbi:hypothetical protein ES708_18385 [subsurface metagenome]